MVATALISSTEGASAETLVLESYVGERPKEADRVLAPLRSALERQGFIATPAEVTKVLRSYRTLPAVTEPHVTTRELTEAFERAHGDWLDGRLDRAATRLEAAVAVAHGVPYLLAAEQKTRDLLFSALLSLSQARNRQHQQAKSEAAMAELIRSFPDQLITRGEHGPEAYELYRAVRRELDAEGRGALIVKVNVPSVVFLDEVPRSQDANGARIADLVTGEYRLLIQSANEPTSFRYYKVPVYAHQITRLEIHWELDSVRDRRLGRISIRHVLAPSKGGRCRLASGARHVDPHGGNAASRDWKTVEARRGESVRSRATEEDLRRSGPPDRQGDRCHIHQRAGEHLGLVSGKLGRQTGRKCREEEQINEVGAVT